MKKVVVLLPIFLAFFSCKKQEHPRMTGNIAYYHVSGNDTLSALYVPSGFTPNGDGVNDIFGPLLVDCDNQSYTMDVFNRNTRIYTSKNPLLLWDGTAKGIKATDGRYTYSISVSDITGYTFRIKGELVLVR